MGGDIPLTRNELDDAIRASLNGFLVVLDEVLAHNGIRDLIAVVSVGGGANIPAVTTTLSRHFRVPVVTTPRPELTAAVGGALRAARGPGDTSATVSAAAAAVTATARAPQAPLSWPRGGSTATFRAPPAGLMAPLAWSETHDDSQASVATGKDPKSDNGSSDTAAAHPAHTARPSSEPKTAGTRWYRRPAVAIIATAIAVLLVGSAAAIALSSRDKSAMTPAPGAITTSASPAPPSPATTDTNPPATTDTPTSTVPSATPQASPPAAAARQVPHQAPVIPRVPAIPALPPIPGINEPIPGLDRINQILQGIGGGAGLGYN